MSHTHAINLSSLLSLHRMCNNAGHRFTLDASIFNRRSQFACKEIEMTQHIRTYLRPKLAAVPNNSGNDTQPTIGSVSPGERVKQLYKCINEKNLKELNEIISRDCYFEDFTFSKPFQGNKEILIFFRQLTMSMGDNVKFNLRNVKEDEVSAWATWHLEWKENEIPFTRGCSIYECSEEEERLVIRKAQVFVEPPIKPGGIVLILLKTITSLFDDFPKASERFLKSPHIVLQWIQRIYIIFVAPFIDPILATYINCWKLMAQMLGYAIGMVIFILKLLFK